MTTDPIDRDLGVALERAFSFALPDDARRSINQRVEAAVASERRYQDTNEPRRQLHIVRPRMLVALAATMMLIAATAAAGGTLFSRLVDGAPIFESVWDRATDVRQSVTNAGFTVTLEKAAVDRARVWVALRVSSDAGGADIWDMSMTDANDVLYSGGTGAGASNTSESATLFGFRVPDAVTPAGPFVLEVTALDVNGEKTPGTWRFVFDAPLTSDRQPVEDG